MDTRVLYIVAIAIAAVSGGYYYYSGSANKLDADDSRNMTYTANDINLTQTNDLGHLYIRAKVDRLEQDMQKQTSKLENLHASMYENGQVNATFSSKAGALQISGGCAITTGFFCQQWFKSRSGK